MSLSNSEFSFVPLHDFVVIEPDVPKDITVGGIALPQSVLETKPQGRVMAVGPGRYMDAIRIPCSVCPGDYVRYESYAGQPLEVDGSDYIIVRDDEIIGIFRERPEAS